MEYQEKEFKNVPFRDANGSLIFLATVWRPDIDYSVNLVSRYHNKYEDSHWLIGFTDAGDAGDTDMRRSVTGYVS